MIDTCQANTMYSKFYSPNILATGSSALSQSSYSHHADADVGVAVIDRYTYYNLEFLENRVKDTNSKVTMGELFDSYDPELIHSEPGIRYDLFPGGEEGARSRLVMDFFGNAQGVVVDEDQKNAAGKKGNDTEWLEELRKIEEMIEEAKRRHNESLRLAPQHVSVMEEVVAREEEERRERRSEGAVKVDEEGVWKKKAAGVAALVGIVGIWAAGSWLES